MDILPAKSPLQMHCPKCNHYGPHKVIKTEPRWYHWSEETVTLFERITGADIRYRVRQKQCCECGYVFESAEISHTQFERLVSAFLSEIERSEALEVKVSNLSTRLGDVVTDQDRQLAKVSEFLASKVPSLLMTELGVAARIELPQSLSSLLRPASEEEIMAKSHGRVWKVRTNLLVAEKGTITCERIFGPTHNWRCSCGKYKRVKHKGIICNNCGVEITLSRVRRERLGHIELPCRIPNPLSGVQEAVSLVAVLPPAYIEQAGLSALAPLYDEIVGASAQADVPRIVNAYRQVVEMIVSMLSKKNPKRKDFDMLALGCGLCRMGS